MERETYRLYAFLRAAHGNWRNALAIICTDCPWGKTESCRGYLLTADEEGRPILIGTEQFATITGEQIDPMECKGFLYRHVLQGVYALYFEWHTVTDEDCPLEQAITLAEQKEYFGREEREKEKYPCSL